MGYGSGRLTNSVVRSAEEEEEERTSNEEPTGMNIYVYRFGHKDFMYIDGGTFLLNTIHCFEHTYCLQLLSMTELSLPSF